MTNDTPKQIKRTQKPIFGMLSVAAPFVGNFAVNLLISAIRDTQSYARTHLVVFILFGTPVCGVVLAMTAWMRGERYRFLPYVGWIVNVGDVFYIAQFLPGSNC